MNKIGRVGLIVAVVAVLLVPTVASIYFARDAGIQNGRAQVLAAENGRLKDSLDLAQVELSEAEYKIQTLTQVAQQMQSKMETMIPVWNAVWCVGMNPEVLGQTAPLVLQTAEYIKDVTEAEGAKVTPQICVLTMTITHSSVRDEIYVVASRAFKGGEPEAFYVYWISDPENADQYIIAGHYDVGAREWHIKIRDDNPDN